MHAGSFLTGDNAWFLGGELNASVNCVDRHALVNPDKVAVIYEGDEPGTGRSLTYGELLREVCRVAHVLKRMGVRKGDIVAVYLPMIPEALVACLACARIGAVHSVIFAGFSSDAARDRILDAKCKVVLTTDEGKRGGKTIHIKNIVDKALAQCPDVTGVLVHKHTGGRRLGGRPRLLVARGGAKVAGIHCPGADGRRGPLVFVIYVRLDGQAQGRAARDGRVPRRSGHHGQVRLRPARGRPLLLRLRRGLDHGTHVRGVRAAAAGRHDGGV